MPCTPVTVRTILNKTKRRDPWFLDDYTLNPYSGCSMGCVFCYVHGSRYGTHTEKKLSYKTNAPELLDKQLSLRAKRGQHGFIVLASSTDPYVHAEKELGLTRRLLEIILHHRFPVHIITRSDLILRDTDILMHIGKTAILPEDLLGKVPSGALITFSFSSVDDRTAHIYEPGATPPSRRLQVLKQILDEGFYAGVSLMPLLPWISDTADQLELSFSTFAQIGARYIFPASLTLYGDQPSDSKIRTLRTIQQHYPHLIDKYRGYFDRSATMPDYYLTALEEKLNRLCEKYRLPNRINIEQNNNRYI